MNKFLLIAISVMLLVSVQGLRVRQNATAGTGGDSTDNCSYDTYEHSDWGPTCTVDSSYCDGSSTYSESCDDGSYYSRYA